MSILIPLSVLLLATAAMAVIRLIRPRFAYHWLIAAAAVLLALPMVIVSRAMLPQVIPLSTHPGDSLFPGSLVLLLDRTSFSYVVGLVILTFASILTDVLRASESDWAAWSSSLLLTILGVLAILAENPFTLLLAWTAIDLIELIILLAQINPSELRVRLVISFATKVAGSGLLIAGMIAARSSGESLTLDNIPPQANLFLLLAAGLRLGILPLHLPFPKELPLRRGFGTIIRMVPAAASLCLVARSASAAEPVAFTSWLLVLAGLAAVYTAAAWLLAANELDGRPFWILGMASFALGSALRGQPSASLAWGLATMLAGGLLFLNARRDRRLNWLFAFGLLGISTLPFSPTWEAALLYTSPFQGATLLYLLAHVLFLLGYLRHAFRPGRSLTGVERWIWVIYPLGLATIPLTYFLWGWWSQPPRSLLLKSAWWTGVLSIGATILIVALLNYMPKIPQLDLRFFKGLSYTHWQYQWGWTIYRLLERVMNFITIVLEGEGGVLWSLLMLVLLVSWLASTSAGGM